MTKTQGLDRRKHVVRVPANDKPIEKVTKFVICTDSGTLRKIMISLPRLRCLEAVDG